MFVFFFEAAPIGASLLLPELIFSEFLQICTMILIPPPLASADHPQLPQETTPLVGSADHPLPSWLSRTQLPGLLVCSGDHPLVVSADPPPPVGLADHPLIDSADPHPGWLRRLPPWFSQHWLSRPSPLVGSADPSLKLAQQATPPWMTEEPPPPLPFGSNI